MLSLAHKLTRRWRGQVRASESLRCILISGEAGTGKTHLAETFLDWVQRQGYVAAVCRVFEGSRELAFSALAEWLRGLYQENPRVWKKLSPNQLSEISRLLPELRARQVRLPEPQPMQEKWQLLHFYETLLQVLLLHSMPLLLFLDDIQWCDAETLAWLGYLETRSYSAQLVLLATARSEALPADHPAKVWFSGTASRLDLELTALDRENTQNLLQVLSGDAVQEEIADKVYHHSQGNPLYISEIFRAGLHHLSEEDFSLPGRIQAVLRWRLAQLTPITRQIVEQAAVIGGSFSYNLLTQATMIDELTLVTSLDEAWQKRILCELENMAYDFSHEKLRQAAYANLSLIHRCLLHKRAAQAMERAWAAARGGRKSSPESIPV